LWSGVQAINAEARASYDTAATTLGDGQFDQIVPATGDAIAQKDYVALRRAGWLVSPVIEGQINGVRILGFDPLSSPVGFGVSQGTQTGDLEPFLSGDRLFANAETARRVQPGLGVAINPAVGSGIVVGDIGVVQRLLNRTDLSRLFVQPDQPLQRPALADIAPQLRLKAASQTADVGELTESFHLNLTAFGLLSFAVGILSSTARSGLPSSNAAGWCGRCARSGSRCPA
jgi:putative ABC transport system permease protein